MKTLDDAATFMSGGTPNKSIPSYWGGNIPWYSAANMSSRFIADTEIKITQEGLNAGSRLAPSGATLLLVRGSGLFNRIPICYAEESVAFNQDVKAICPKPETDGLFLHFWLESLRPVLNENIGVTGIGAGKFELDFLKKLPFPDLPKEDQESIGRSAALFDKKIELNRHMNETLEAMARAIFKDWFVDFGPTRAKMEGRAPYLAPDVWSLFPDSLDDEGKPEGWKTSTIGEETEVLGGSTPSTHETSFWGGNISWATPKDLSALSSSVLLRTERQITDTGLSQISSGLLPAGTVLLSSRAPIGYLAISQIPITINQGFIAMICKKTISNIFVYFWTKQNMETIHQKANGSTFQEISKTNFKPIKMVVPTSEVLFEFQETTKLLFRKIVLNERANNTLVLTRDFLLPKLMSDEIQVRDAEKVLESIS